MTTLADLLASGPPLAAHDVAQIAARLAGLVRYGHELEAVHGDITADTVLVDRRGDDWEVQLDQPRPGRPAGPPEPAADIVALGHVVEELSRALPVGAPVPASLAAALASMTSASADQGPTAAQVELYFGRDLPGELEHAEQERLEQQRVEQQRVEQERLEEQERAERERLQDDRAEEERTELIPVGAPARASAAEGDDGGWDTEILAPSPEPEPAAHPPSPAAGRSGRGAVVASSLVLLLGLGALGYVGWQILRPAPEENLTATSERPPQEDTTTLAERTGTTRGTATDDAVADGATAEETTTAPEETGTTGGTDEVEASGSLWGDEEEADQETAASTSLDDRTDPAWADHGWDVQALDDAYCRDGSRFVGLADTETYRGVVCSTGFGYDYRGLNKAANATLLASAEATDEGWVGHGTGGVRYEFDPDRFMIRDGDGTVLDDEPVTLWLTPDDEPFRPGDLDLSQPISFPSCDGSGVVVHSSHQEPGRDAETVQAALDAVPGSFYVRTDLSCDNFNRPSRETRSEGNYIYAVLTYGGDTTTALCRSIEGAGGDAYGYFLAEGVPPGQIITCE